MSLEKRVSLLEEKLGKARSDKVVLVIVSGDETEQEAIARCGAENAEIRFIIHEGE